MLLPLYLRREPTTDHVLAECVRKGIAAPDSMSRAFDVVAYRDPDATRPAGRWMWWNPQRPDRRFHRITLNCYSWRAVWLD